MPTADKNCLMKLSKHLSIFNIRKGHGPKPMVITLKVLDKAATIPAEAIDSIEEVSSGSPSEMSSESLATNQVKVPKKFVASFGTPFGNPSPLKASPCSSRSHVDPAPGEDSRHPRAKSSQPSRAVSADMGKISPYPANPLPSPRYRRPTTKGIKC